MVLPASLPASLSHVLWDNIFLAVNIHFTVSGFPLRLLKTLKTLFSMLSWFWLHIIYGIVVTSAPASFSKSSLSLATFLFIFYLLLQWLHTDPLSITVRCVHLETFFMLFYCLIEMTMDSSLCTFAVPLLLWMHTAKMSILLIFYF